jgi:hypothetical protein
MHRAYQRSAIVKLKRPYISHIPYLFPDEETALKFTARMVNEHQDMQGVHSATVNAQNFKTSRCVLSANGITWETDIKDVSIDVKRQLCVINKLDSTGDCRNIYSVINAVNTNDEEWKLLDKVFDLAMKHQLKGMARYEQIAKKKSAKKSVKKTGKKTKNMKKLETGDIPKNFVTKELYSNVTVQVRYHILKMLGSKLMSIAEVSSLVHSEWSHRRTSSAHHNLSQLICTSQIFQASKMIAKAKAMANMKKMIIKQLEQPSWTAAEKSFPMTLNRDKMEAALSAGAIPWKTMPSKERNKLKAMTEGQKLEKEYEYIPVATRILIDDCRRSASAGAGGGKAVDDKWEDFLLPGT